ncbi:MATE family efflux transporter [Desulfovibrio ferrophilus]|uniref:Multidrug-efflux transporter n=1 Tax=Desulfovibrio ferrophilus TaxID=241368 RepID=A0A2Z6B2W9_9BACT|nr:MATE family efflux transporter [Desulfovibrio ferrophilus]BBD09847.1 MATE efflux family protein [Desulfovibrio ferrophilus]
MNAITRRWNAPNGYRHVLHIGLPLMASMLSATVTQFTDRIFLAQYSLETLAASLSASITNFTLMAFFMGMVSYVNVFVAQYTGAGRHERLGSALWQGVWLALASGVIIAVLSLPAPQFFAFVGHTPEVQVMEISYFRILCFGAVLNILAMALSTFYSGRGLTRPVMLVNMIGAAVNIPLDYALINGAWGAPEMGIEGAGYATVFAWGLTAVLFAALIFRRRYEEKYRMISSFGLDRELFGRLLKFGAPGGAQFFLDVFGFMAFVLIVGRIGNDQLAATNMVFSLNHFTFLPMIGLHIAVETLVGQSIGAKRPQDGEEATKSCVQLCVAWGLSIGAIFVLFPEPLLAAFKPAAYTVAQYAPIAETGRILLLFVVAYTVFDGVVIAYTGALKGAGDTRYIMLLAGFMSLFVMILPTFIVVEVLHLGLYAAWTCLVTFLIVYAGFAYLRFRSGRWKKLSVIEH